MPKYVTTEHMVQCKQCEIVCASRELIFEETEVRDVDNTGRHITYKTCHNFNCPKCGYAVNSITF